MRMRVLLANQLLVWAMVLFMDLMLARDCALDFQLENNSNCVESSRGCK